MTTRTRSSAISRRALFLAFLVAAAALLVHLAGCDGIGDPIAPDVSGGRLQGRVLTGGLPCLGFIEAIPVDGETSLRKEYRIELMDDGRFHLDVPAGRYVVELHLHQGGQYGYSFSGPATGKSPPDTLNVDAFHDTGHLEFPLAGLAVPLEFPGEDTDNLWIGATLFRSEQDSWHYRSALMSGSTNLEGNVGEITLAGILQGRYRVRLAINNETLWLPSFPDSASAAWYDVPTDSLLTIPYHQNTPPAHLAGRVGGAWLELGSTSEPRVFFIALDSTSITDFSVEEDGTFARDLFWPQPLKVLVYQNGPPQYVGGPSFAEASVFDPQPGQTITGIDIQTAAILVKPSISLETSWGYFPGQFELYDPDDLTLIARFRSWEDSPETIVLSNFWEGRFLLRIALPESERGFMPWYDQWYDGAVDSDQARSIDITQPSEILHLPWNVQVGGGVSGRVEASNTQTSILVYVAQADGESIWTQYWTRSYQEFELIGLPDGEYKVGAAYWSDVSGYSDSEILDIAVWYPGTGWDSAGIITIEDAGTVEGIEIPLD